MSLVDYFGQTDVGVIRNNNEDYFGIYTPPDGGFVFIVADGLGGHLAGEIASRIGVKRLGEMVKNGISGDPADFFNNAIKTINREIENLGKKDPDKRGMGTTLSVLYIKDNKAYIAHVGDSRIYKISHGKIERLTEDHSFVEKLLNDGLISEDEARRHPRRNVLLQMVGMKMDVNPQMKGPIPIESGDKFLLCTDGLTNMVVDAEILELFSRLPVRDAVEYLIDLAKKRGGPDNITVIGVHVKGEETSDTKDITPLETKEESFFMEEMVSVNDNKRFKLLLWVILGLLITLLFFTLTITFLSFKKAKKGEATSGIVLAPYMKIEGLDDR